LNAKVFATVLKPYFWPDATATSATLNRLRALTTWFCVGAAKTCSLFGPIFLGRAATALAALDYSECIRNTVIYTALNFASSFFKESQSLVYLKVAQAAFVQLSEVSFSHLHSLSLDWHLKKKLGEVIRSMDRGILACDTLMKYLFLWLIPAIAECIVVVIIFATYFDYFPLAVAVFYFVFAYIILTIVTTLWRKQFRKEVAKSDNNWHDRCTDSLINFETVKYFTAEEYEMKRFGEAVEEFQHGSVNVAASLSFLNISQQLLLQACLATSLILSTIAIREGHMQIGDFVSVLTYTLNLFMPLNFLGSVYNAIVMAMVDLTNLSELLAESPDVSDTPDALAIPPINEYDPDTVVEFDNVVFHYPSQSDKGGLKGVSFKMTKGTMTAVVGPTGAGKTTVSRLLFRFYDVLGGAIKVNGMDVRVAKQKSLREAIGVVPQATTLFNDTIGANIRYGRRDATDEELDEVAEAAQLTTFIKSLPEGWETAVGDRGLKLSGGEKQRVGK
jgi:ABC-type transport system involved in Fe-S cluster assembly fused permease/ATPase subunit